MPGGLAAAALMAAAAMTATGCSQRFASFDQGAGRWASTPAPAQQNNNNNNTSPTATAAHMTNGAPAGAHGIAVAQPARSAGMVSTRRAFDPLWIESAAAAERQRPNANWQPYGTTTVAFSGPAQLPTTDPHDYTSMPQLRTGGLDHAGAAAANATGLDDGPEGLAHVTFAPEGADFDPCVSRDGRFMVFASTQHRASSDIYFKKIDGRTITQLTADPGQDVMPAISPDGRRVAFCSNRRGNWDVFVMSISGGQAVQITSEASHELHPTWSPDGTKLAFCRLGETSGRWELWVTDANGSNTNEFIGYGLFPQWSPRAGTGEKGRDKILFQRSRERGDRAFSVWTVDYKPGDASSPTEIVSSSSAALINAAWSPDGQSLVYATVNNPSASMANAETGQPVATSDLWITNIDGTGRVALTSGRHLNLMPSWSIDGRIFFVSDRTGTNNIWSLGTEKAMLAAKGGTMPAHGQNPTENASFVAGESHETPAMPETPGEPSTANAPSEEIDDQPGR
jgi:TolB protein